MDAYREKMTKGSLSADETRVAIRLCKEFGERLGRQHFCAQVGDL